MRVYQVNTFCGIKSTGRIAWEISKLVLEGGGEARIAYGAETPSVESAPYAYQVGNVIGRKVHGALRKLIDGEGYGSYWATKKLIDDIKRFQPHLIHLHNLHGAYLHIPTLFRYLRLANLPIVWTLHDCWTFTGHCAYFDMSGCKKWLKECQHCPSLLQYPVCKGMDGSKRNHRMKKRFFTMPDAITFVPPCNWLDKLLKQSFLNKYQSRVIYNGINLDVFKPTASDLQERFSLENCHIVVSVASDWDERKGLPYLINAAETLGNDYRFVIIGLTQEQMDQLPAGMLGITHTADAYELAAWYTLADCFANPTLEDNMPMVNLEALACGAPIAVFNTGGCPEAVTSECGIVVAKGDQTAFTEAIRTLCDQGNDIRNACIERSHFFDSRKTFQAYVKLYEELCK